MPEHDPVKLTLSISQIAPLIGLDNYNNFPRIVCEIWRKYNPVEFREYESAILKECVGIKLVNSNDYNDIWDIDNICGTNILQQINTLNDNKAKSSYGMVQSQNDIINYVNTQQNINAIQKTDLIKKICSITNKTHGINNEDDIITEFCRISDKTLKQEQGWVSIPLPATTTDNLILWEIIGKYDGITTDNELIEAKMRQKGLFKTMRDYETVQVQLYLHGLGFTQGYLVENFTNKKNEKQLFIHEIQYDAEYVNELLLMRITRFTQFFEYIMNNDNINKKTILTNLLKGDDNKRTIYNDYLVKYLDIGIISF